MLNLNQIRPLDENDKVEIVDDACHIYIHPKFNKSKSSATAQLKITANGEVLLLSTIGLPTRNWEVHAECFNRALAYSKLVRFLNSE
jgi:hypothetical protein